MREDIEWTEQLIREEKNAWEHLANITCFREQIKS